MPSPKIKHCPLCGFADIERGVNKYKLTGGAMHYIRCLFCGCEVRKTSPRACLKRWNTRHQYKLQTEFNHKLIVSTH